MNEKEKVFYALCEHDCDFLIGHLPYSCRLIVQHTGLSMYKVKKYIRMLRDEGLVDKDIYVPGESTIPLCGFVVTKKGRSTKIYRCLWHERLMQYNEFVCFRPISFLIRGEID